MRIADLLLERTNLLKKLRNWKFISLILVFALIIIASSGNDSFNSGLNSKISSDYIAQINIDEVMFENPKVDEMFTRVKNDSKAKALIIYVNTPGGSPVAAEKIYKYVEEIKKTRPVITSMGTVAASAGYLLALSSDRIFAYNTTITGSIGVISQTTEIVDFGKKIGVNFHSFKSSPLKAAPNPTEKLNDEVDSAIREIINDTYTYFKNLVQINRKLTDEEVKKYCNGQIFTGRLALKYKLIDQIGTTEDAVLWLKKEKNIPENLEVILIKPIRTVDYSRFFDIMADNYNKFRSFFNTKIMMIY